MTAKYSRPAMLPPPPPPAFQPIVRVSRVTPRHGAIPGAQAHQPCCPAERLRLRMPRDGGAQRGVHVLRKSVRRGAVDTRPAPDTPVPSS